MRAVSQGKLAFEHIAWISVSQNCMAKSSEVTKASRVLLFGKGEIQVSFENLSCHVQKNNLCDLEDSGHFIESSLPNYFWGER